MKTKFEKSSNIITFEQENDSEKIFALLGTKYGDGAENCSMLASEKQMEELGINSDEWSKDFHELEIGESATYGYWFYDKANVIVRLA